MDGEKASISIARPLDNAGKRGNRGNAPSIYVYIYIDRGNAIHRGGFVRNRRKFAEIGGLREIKVSTCRSFYCTIDRKSRRWQFREKEEKKKKGGKSIVNSRLFRLKIAKVDVFGGEIDENRESVREREREKE